MKNKTFTALTNYVIAIFLGVFLTFAFAPYSIFPLAVIAPAGLLVLWLRAANSLKQTFWLGYFFGLGLFGGGVYWIFISIHEFGGVPSAFAALITIAMIAFLALYPAITGFLTNRYFPINNTQKLVYAFPAIWVLSEWVRSWLLSGFPWFFLGYSQTNSPLKGYAALLSVYSVSLVVLMSSGLIVNAVIRYKQKAFHSMYYNLLALSLIWILGASLTFIPWTKTQGQPISVALVQGNIPQSVKWSEEHVQLSLDRYSELTQNLWNKNKIIIWPEAAIPLPLQNIESFINELDKKAKENKTTLILGIPIRASDGKSYYNAVITLGNQKNQVYQKRHLVPFGEYVPFANELANTLQFMDIPMSDMIPGDNHQPPFIVNDIKILPSICYEIAFPELTRDEDKSINMLLVVTNDAWFGESNAEAQHLQMAAMRAIEFHKPVLFVSNDGITAVINANGQIEKAAPQRKTLVLEATVQPMYGLTPWLTNGTSPLFIILFYLLFLSVLANKKTMKNKTDEELSKNIL